MNHSAHHSSPPARVARVVLVAFVLTFCTARVLVLLIMSRRVPDLYVHVGGTHVHHLNFGIFILSAVGAYLLFARPTGRVASVAAVAYGAGLALTFDEFGMWVHLGGPYWQRASFDAVVVIAALLTLIAVAPALKRYRPRTWWTAAALMVAVGVFGYLLVRSWNYAGREYGPRLRVLEDRSPP